MSGRVWLTESTEDGQVFCVWLDGDCVAVTTRDTSDDCEPTERDRKIANAIVEALENIA
jgi:hypothetical protein